MTSALLYTNAPRGAEITRAAGQVEVIVVAFDTHSKQGWSSGCSGTFPRLLEWIVLKVAGVDRFKGRWSGSFQRLLEWTASKTAEQSRATRA
eukprot:3631161-Pleurochrysis_carterae.AAC.1